MGKIGDLWVKLGLKSDDYKKGVAEVGKTNEGFKLNVSTLKKVGVAAWGAMAAAVIKFAKDAVTMTQKWGDAWNNTMAGIQSAYGSFVRQLSSGEGWSNLFQNMAEAYRQGKEISAALDEVFERKISFGYQEAQINLQISELNKIMRDQSKSDAERKAAADAIVEKEKELAAVKKDIWAQEAKAHRDNFKLQTGLNDEQTDLLVKEYNQNRAIIQQANEYASTLQELEARRARLTYGGGGAAVNSREIADINNQIRTLQANTDQSIKDVADLVAKYNLGNDSLVKAMADAEVAVINIDTAANNASMRATAFLGSMNKGLKEDVELAKDLVDALDEIIAGANRVQQQLLDDLTSPLGGASTPAGAETTGSSVLAGSFARGQELANLADENSRHLAKMQAAAEDLAYTLEDSLIGAFDELVDALMGIEGADAKSIFIALLRPIADTALQAGAMVLGIGEAVEALKASLTTLSGPVAIAAGASLVALGVAAKVGMAALSRGSSATSSMTAATTSGATGMNATQGNMEMTIHIEGKLKGSDIVLAGQRTNAAWAR